MRLLFSKFKLKFTAWIVFFKFLGFSVFSEIILSFKLFLIFCLIEGLFCILILKIVEYTGFDFDALILFWWLNDKFWILQDLSNDFTNNFSTDFSKDLSYNLSHDLSNDLSIALLIWIFVCEFFFR